MTDTKLSANRPAIIIVAITILILLAGALSAIRWAPSQEYNIPHEDEVTSVLETSTKERPKMKPSRSQARTLLFADIGLPPPVTLLDSSATVAPTVTVPKDADFSFHASTATATPPPKPKPKPKPAPLATPQQHPTPATGRAQATAPSASAPNPSTAPRSDSTAPTQEEPPVSSAGSGGGYTPADAKVIARQSVASRGWGDDSYQCLLKLWERESNWNYKAANPTSTARGIPQALMSTHFGSNWRNNAKAQEYLNTPSVQIQWGLNYIAGRYANPCAAWAHSERTGWY